MNKIYPTKKQVTGKDGLVSVTITRRSDGTSRTERITPEVLDRLLKCSIFDVDIKINLPEEEEEEKGE